MAGEHTTGGGTRSLLRRSPRRFLTDESGRPLVIEGFQRLVLADYFDGARETVVLLVGKKNGKTSLFAAVALWHVLDHHPSSPTWRSSPPRQGTRPGSCS